MSFLSHRVTKNAAALGLIQLSNYALPLLLLPYLTRTLGKELFGVVAFGMSIVQLAFVVTDYGFSLSATEDISIHRDDKRYVEETFSAIFTVKCFLLVVVALILMIFVEYSEKYSTYKLFLLLSFLPIIGQAFQPIWLFQGIERMKYVTIYTVAARVIYFLFVLLFVKDTHDYVLVPVMNGVAQITAALLAIYLFFKMGLKLRKTTLQRVIKVFNNSTHFFFSRISVSLYTSGSVFFLGIFGSLNQVAIYSIAEQIYKGLQGFYMPINQALFPYMSKEKNYKLFFRVVASVFGIGFASLALGALITEDLVSFLFGQSYLESVNIIYIFYFVLLVNILGVFFGYGFLSSFGKVSFANTSVIIGSIGHIAILFVLGLVYGLNAYLIVMTVLFTELMVFMMRGQYSYSLYKQYVHNYA